MSCASAWSTTRSVAISTTWAPQPNEVSKAPFSIASGRAETEPRGRGTAQGAALDPLREQLAGARRAPDAPHHRGRGRGRRMRAAGLVVAWAPGGGAAGRPPFGAPTIPTPAL